MPIFGVRNFTLNQYLGSVNYNMDKSSIFGVHKFEERKHCAIALKLRIMKEMSWYYSKTEKDQEAQIEIFKNILGAPEIYNNIWGL